MSRRKKELKKLKEFGLKYEIWDDREKDISYTKSVELIQKFLYFNLEHEYEKFINKFNILHDIKPKDSIPPKLNFRNMKNGINEQLSTGDIRKFKINEALKNIDDDNEEEIQI